MGNTAAELATHSGDFQNLLPLGNWPGDYWSGTEYAPNTARAWAFNASFGNLYNTSKGHEFLAMAVRPGDVLVATPTNDVPEPGTLLLTAAALAGLGFIRRHRAV